jgi:hypothetical protein
MREIHMVSRLQETPPVGNARCIPAHAVAEQRAHIGFVESGKMPDPVSVAARDQGGIVGEPKRDIAVLPSAKIVQRLRQVPMIEAQPGLYAVAEQFVDQTIVEVEAQAVGLAASLWQHAWPGHGKPVNLRAKAPHQRDVFAVAMVVVTRHIAGIAIGNTARLSAEQVPDAGAATVLCGSPLDLISRGGDAPFERCRQRQGGRHGADRHSFTISSSRSHEPLPPISVATCFCRRLRRSILRDNHPDAVSASTCSTRWKNPSTNPARPTATTVADGNSLTSNSAISRWAAASSEFVASDSKIQSGR